MKRHRLDLRCAECGKTACYGLGGMTYLDQPTKWWCAEHVPAGFLPGKKGRREETPAGRDSKPISRYGQGSLF
jgi:hypothetical protein